MLPPELVRGQVLQAAVRTHRVVVATPVLDHHARLGARAEPLQGQTLVRAQVARRPVSADELGQGPDHPLGTDGACHVDRQAFPGELVDDGQAFDLLAIGAGIEDEVVGPHEVRVGGRQRSGPAGGNPASRTPPRQLQTRLAPEPMGTLLGELVTGPAQEDAHAPVAVARILRREPLERLDERRALRWHAQDVLQRRARDSD